MGFSAFHPNNATFFLQEILQNNHTFASSLTQKLLFNARKISGFSKDASANHARLVLLGVDVAQTHTTLLKIQGFNGILTEDAEDSKFTGWWLNQPNWKICSSKWGSSPIFGVNIKNYLKPPPRKDWKGGCNVWPLFKKNAKKYPLSTSTNRNRSIKHWQSSSGFCKYDACLLIPFCFWWGSTVPSQQGLGKGKFGFEWIPLPSTFQVM